MKPEADVVVERTIPTTRSQLFSAWKSSNAMAVWFAPPDGDAVVEADFRAGGTYRIDVKNASGEQHQQFGRYLEIVPDSRLVFTWTCAAMGVFDSVVTVEFENADGMTRMRLVHTLPPDPDIRRLHEEGWAICFRQLEAFMTKPADRS